MKPTATKIGEVTSMVNAMAQRNIQSTQQTDRDNSRTRRPIELQTENDFCIIRRCDMDEKSSRTGTEHYFVVRDPYGHELENIVSFSESAIAEAFGRSSGRLTLESAFWLTCAERHLAEYLWKNDDYPPDAGITVDRLTPDDIDLVQRCGTNQENSEAQQK